MTAPVGNIGWQIQLPLRGAPIDRLGFDGRLLAETTLLACWRLATDAERDAAKKGDFEFTDHLRNSNG